MKKNFTYLFTAFAILLASAAYAQPANDNAVNAILLNVDGSTNVYSNVDATAEAGEVLPPSNDLDDCLTEWCDDNATPDNSMWFKFLAPADGKVTISGCDGTSDLEVDSQFAIWTVVDSADFTTFSLVSANDDNPDGCDGLSSLSSYLQLCDLTSDAIYYLQVDGWDGVLGGGEGDIYLTLSNSCSAPVVIGADDVCDPILLLVDGSINSYTNAFATADADEVAPNFTDGFGNTDWSQFDSLAQNSIWFTFEAPATGSVLITTCNPGGTFNDTQIAVYSSSDCNYDNFSTIAANDDATCSISNLKSTLIACDLIEGELYYLQVDGYDGATGDIAISLTESDPCVPPVLPENDNVCNAISLSVDGSVNIYSNVNATAEVGEVTPTVTDGGGITDWFSGDVAVQQSIWFKFAAPASGAVTITTCNEGTTTNDTQIAVWSSSNCEFSNFESVSANDDDAECALGGASSTLRSTMLVCELTEAQVYYLQVDGYLFGGVVSEGDIAISLTVDECVSSLKENESISGVSTYPNPANDQLTLNFNLKNNNRVSVEVYDILGNKVLAENFGQLSSGQNKKEIQLSGLAAGLYNMNLLVNGTVLTQKVQVAK